MHFATDSNAMQKEIEEIRTDIELEAFGIRYQRQRALGKGRKRAPKDLNTVFKEQTDRLDKVLREGYTARDINAGIYKLRNTIVGPKIKLTEPVCINDSKTGELITDIDQIKQKSLEHNTQILTKNPIREQDKHILEEKEEMHRRIMSKSPPLSPLPYIVVEYHFTPHPPIKLSL